MKKLTALALVIAAVLSLTACSTATGEKNSVAESSDSLQTQSSDNADDTSSNSENTDSTVTEPPASDFEYNYDDALSGIVITKYIGTDKAIRVPSEIDGKPVKQIAGLAFFDNNVTYLEIPDTITSVGESVFTTYYLVNVILPDTLTEIGKRSFSQCRDLESISIPDGVTIIDKGAFSACIELKTVTIPGSVKTIATDAFFECIALENVTMSEGVETIGTCAFAHCKNLKTLAIPDSVTNISDKAFERCDSLTVTYKEKEYNSDNFNELYNLFK